MRSLVTSFTYHVFKIHSSGSLCIRTLLFFIAEYYSVIQIYHISLTHSAIYPLKIKQTPIYIRRVNYLALRWTGHLLIPSTIHSKLSLHTCKGNDPMGGTSQMWQWVAKPCKHKPSCSGNSPGPPTCALFHSLGGVLTDTYSLHCGSLHKELCYQYLWLPLGSMQSLECTQAAALRLSFSPLLQIWPHHLVTSTYCVPGTLMVINKIWYQLSRRAESSRKDQTNTQRTDSCQMEQN